MTEWVFDANHDNQPDVAEVYFTPYVIDAPVPQFPTPRSTRVQVITYKIAPIPKPVDRV